MDFFIDFFSDTQTNSPIDLLINIVLSAVFSYLVYIVYIKFGSVSSGKKQFGSSFLLLTICTALIIALIKSSVALSLGLVGALSIVRFRTAIKEPEELTYLFFCIAIGLGFGANQRLITAASTILIMLILIIKRLASKKDKTNAFNFSVRTSQIDIKQITEITSSYFKNVSLVRFSKDNGSIEALLVVDIPSVAKLDECEKAFSEADENVRIDFLESR